MFSSLQQTTRTVTAAFLLLASGLATDLGAVEETGELKQSLNGTWQFTIAPATAQGQGEWDALDVPGNWDVQPRYSNHLGQAWYRRDFAVPADWKGRHVRLRFEAVYQEAEVTLNGHRLGGHTGGYTPFEFDVTDLINYNGGKNTVTVKADNTYSRGAWWPWGGISRDVSLIANNDARIVWQHIWAEPDLAKGNATVRVRYKLANASNSPLPVSLSSVIEGTSISPFVTTIMVPPESETIGEAAVVLPPQDVRLWHFDHPNLYTLATTLIAGGKVLHSRKDRFGIRKVEVTAGGLLLNGERIRVGGFNRVNDSNTTGNTEPDDLVRKDVDLMKNAGAVFARLSHVPMAPNLLDYLDEKGMLIFEEIPVWGSGDPHLKKDNPLTKQWLREMIERDYNHPCIIGWSPGNELTKHYDYVASMNDYIRKELDPHRLVAYVSFTAYRDDHGPKNDPVTVSDLALINTYANGGNGEIFAERVNKMRARWPGLPIFFSEYGSRQIGGSLKAQIPNLRSIWENMTRDPAVIGGSLWTFNDYRSGFPGTPASGNREWGVVTVDRQPKNAYWQIRKLYSPVRSLSVANGVVTLQPRSLDEVPSYTLRGYTVAWTLSGASGARTAQGNFSLPDIAPGSTAWIGEIPGAQNAAKVTAWLVTPTGYRVDDTMKRLGQ